MDLLYSEEERLLQQTVRDYVDNEIAPKAAELDESGAFPWENMRGLAALGLTGLAIDPEYGGSGGTYRQIAIASEEIARGCGATSVTFIAHHSLATQSIYQLGTEGQKQRFVPPLVSCEKVGSFCLTEPGSGSDAAALATSATKKDGHYLLNGSKLFITNGEVADTFVVFATHDRSLRARGISALVVERGSKGLTTNPQHGKMGMRASSTAEVVFEDCPTPEENRLGEEGRGFIAAMRVLDSSRIAISAQCVGIAQAAFEAAVRYAKHRESFGKPIADFQAIQWMIADMATNIDAARLLTLRAAALRDQGLPFTTEASMAKLFAAQVATDSTSKAVQIHGGYGYFRPNPVERYFRDARVLEIYEGTSEIQRLVISRNILQNMPV